MAHKKGVGSSRNGRDSQSKRLGSKTSDGKIVTGGSVLVRQRGNQFWPGEHVGQGKDFTLFACVPGTVHFEQRGRRQRRYIDIVPLADETAAPQPAMAETATE